MKIGTKTLAIKTEDGTVYSMRFVASTAVPVHVVEVTCEGSIHDLKKRNGDG